MQEFYGTKAHVENIPAKQQTPLYLRVLAVTCARFFFFFTRGCLEEITRVLISPRAVSEIFLLPTLISASHVLPPFTRAISCAIFLFARRHIYQNLNSVRDQLTFFYFTNLHA